MAFQLVMSIVGLIVFVGLTSRVRQRGDRGRKAIIGALALYLDFIDLFLLLLQLFGRRRLD